MLKSKTNNFQLQILTQSQIMCGMGKTGTLHAWEQEGIRGPDLQTIGKALGAGFLPLSAVLVHEKIFDALVKGSGGLAHGHTFQVRVSRDPSPETRYNFWC